MSGTHLARISKNTASLITQTIALKEDLNRSYNYIIIGLAQVEQEYRTNIERIIEAIQCIASPISATRDNRNSSSVTDAVVSMYIFS